MSELARLAALILRWPLAAPRFCPSFCPSLGLQVGGRNGSNLSGFPVSLAFWGLWAGFQPSPKPKVESSNLSCPARQVPYGRLGCRRIGGCWISPLNCIWWQFWGVFPWAKNSAGVRFPLPLDPSRNLGKRGDHFVGPSHAWARAPWTGQPDLPPCGSHIRATPPDGTRPPFPPALREVQLWP